MTGKKKKPILWIVLTSVFGFLPIVFNAAIIIGAINAVTINWAFNIAPYMVVGSDEKGEVHFKSEYTKKDAKGNTLIGDDGKEVYDSTALAAAGEAMTEEVGKEGFVLLKNDGALPISKSSTISLFGASVASVVTSGTGSGATSGSNATYLTSLAKGGLTVNSASYSFYTEGEGKNYRRSVPGMHDTKPFIINECPWNVITASASYNKMTDADTALVVFSRNGGEGYDLASGANYVGKDTGEIVCQDALTKAQGSLTGNNYLELNGDERGLLAGLKSLKDQGKIDNIVVVLNSANALELDFLNKDICGVDYGVDACLWIGATGLSGLNGLGPILSGDVNPSGKLIDTYCYDNLREPSIYNFGHIVYNNFDAEYKSKSAQEGTDNHLNQKYYNVYREGIYVGYRYYETRYEDYVLGNTDGFDYDEIVAYSFGHGQSYTTFEYSDFDVTENDKDFTVSVNVKNTGSTYAGKEVVEVYAQTPYSQYDRDNKIENAAIELVGFAKTKMLAAGADETVAITVDKELLTSYDAYNKRTYIMDSGDYYFALGNGAHDALNRILAKKPSADASKIVPASHPIVSAEDLVYSWTESTLDDTTYKTSSSTGTEITNQFDHADLRLYENGAQSIDYVSRSNWNATFDISSLAKMKESFVNLAMTDAMYADLKNEQYTPPAQASSAKMPTMDAKNGLKLAMFVGVGLDEKIEFNNQEYGWDDLLDQVSFVEMRDLIVMGQHCTRVVRSVSKPATTDHNGPSGFSASFVGGGQGTAYPAPCVRAATWNVELVKRVGELIGEDGLHSGCNGLYGPGANTHRNAYSGRNFEYYSEDPCISSTIGEYECVGIQSKGIIVYEKHFALNDSETHREGLCTWANEQSIREIYLEAFRGIMKIDGGNAHATMSAFNRYGTIWAGNSNGLMNNVLRGEWGFDGFIVTDADSCNGGVLCAAYMFAPRAITTGTDIYDGNNNHKRDGQLNAYKNDAYIVSCMRQSTKRILYSVANSAAMNGISPKSEVIEIMPWWQILLVSLVVTFGVLTVAALVMLILKLKKKN